MITSVEHSQVNGQRVLVRVDWNVAFSPDGQIADDFRIKTTLPTLRLLRKKKAEKIILATHLGNPVVRPGDQFHRILLGNERLSTRQLIPTVRQLLRMAAAPSDHETIVPGLPLPGYRLADNLILLENLRFHPGELADDHQFGEQLASLADVFVNEAFAEAHRAVASLTVPPRRLPGFAGLNLLAELEHLGMFADKPPKPSVMVLGGAKVHDKAMLIDTLLKKIDIFLLGGVMANTFLAAQGVDLKRSLIEPDRLDVIRGLLNRAPQKFILPIDFVWERDRALDIGSQTMALFRRYLAKAQLIFWNGPMGWTASGRERFMHGSKGVASAMAASSATTVVAGGDTLAIVDALHLAERMTFRSTGGGATLAYLAGDELPGLVALEQ